MRDLGEGVFQNIKNCTFSRKSGRSLQFCSEHSETTCLWFLKNGGWSNLPSDQMLLPLVPHIVQVANNAPPPHPFCILDRQGRKMDLSVTSGRARRDVRLGSLSSLPGGRLRLGQCPFASRSSSSKPSQSKPNLANPTMMTCHHSGAAAAGGDGGPSVSVPA